MGEGEMVDAGTREAYEAALEAGERAHVLTIGSPARGLCLRVAMGRLDQHGRFHDRWPDVFVIWRGCRWDRGEIGEHARERAWSWLAGHLPRPLAYYATIRLGVHATTGAYSDQVVPELTFFDALKRWEVKRG